MIGLDNPCNGCRTRRAVELLDVYPTDGETFGRVAGGLYFFAVAPALTAAARLVTNRRDA